MSPTDCAHICDCECHQPRKTTAPFEISEVEPRYIIKVGEVIHVIPDSACCGDRCKICHQPIKTGLLPEHLVECHHIAQREILNKM